VLIAAIAVLTTQLVGPLLPRAFVWAGAVVLGTGVLFLLVPPPTED
jgi:hypothetical protein